MLTLRTARGAVAPTTLVLLTTALAACAGPSGSPTALPTTAAPTTTAPTTLSTSATAASTPDPKPSATRTVYVGPNPTGSLVPWDEPSPTATGSGPTPSAAAGAADLNILLDDGFGIRATWTLTCGPAGGSHPAPEVACGVLGAKGTGALRSSTSTTCAEQYGGPQKALVTGTWRGTAVKSQFTLENACEIERWTAMIGVLPQGGV